jgi:HlyD family secretion protein
VQDVFFRAGEVVNAGQPVLSLLPPQNLRLRFYVPEPLLATLSLGQAIFVTCDSCPAGPEAKISFISREAEYTPPVIFSEQERAKLVFRVEARPTAPLNLPLGLPLSVSAAPAEKQGWMEDIRSGRSGAIPGVLLRSSSRSRDSRSPSVGARS